MLVELDWQRRQNTHNYCKHRSRRLPRGYDRPGRSDDAERRYRRGKEHFGKGKTLRTHRV